MIVLILPDVTQDETDLAQARQGNREALARIYEHYKEPVYQFVRLRVGDAATAEDITAQVFLKLIRALRSAHPPQQSLRGWIFRVARNAIYDHYGEPTALPVETLDQWLAAPASDPELQVIHELDAARARQALRMLAPTHQEVLLLRFDQQLSLRETADIMDKNVNTIKALQFRAISTLRQILQAQSEESA
jgi:RNA polymerase sigma-70 factor (ECF subfamily)